MKLLLRPPQLSVETESSRRYSQSSHNLQQSASDLTVHSQLFLLSSKENHQAARILRLRKCWGTISSQSNIRKHESGSRSVGATTAGLSQLDGASLLSVTPPENRSTQRELEEETKEGGRRDACSPECFVMFGTNVLHLTSLLVCTHFMIHFQAKKKKKNTEKN